MKAVMFTVPCSPERVRFSNALHHATAVIRSIAIEWCRWEDNDFIFEGDQARYEKLYFWVCGYVDALAVIENEQSKSTCQPK